MPAPDFALVPKTRAPRPHPQQAVSFPDVEFPLQDFLVGLPSH